MGDIAQRDDHATGGGRGQGVGVPFARHADAGDLDSTVGAARGGGQ